MRKLVLALGAATMVALPAAAQPAAAGEAAVDAHADLYDSIQQGVDKNAMMDNVVAAFAQGLVEADPALEFVEAENPGLMQALAEAIRPVLVRYSERVQRDYQSRLIDILRQSVTADEAVKIAAFYRSEIGRALLMEISVQSDLRDTVGDGLADRDISAQSVQRDAVRTAGRAIRGLTPTQLAELNAAAAAVPELAKMGVYSERSLPLRTEMQNAPLTAEEEAELEKLIVAVFERYYPPDAEE